MTTATKQTSSRPDTVPADVWRQKAVHTVTGPSGATFKIRVPGIPTMLANGFLPNHLYSLALLDLEHPNGAAAGLRQMLDDALDDEKREQVVEQIKKLAEYQQRIAAASLVEPELSFEDIQSGEFPEDDLSMVVEIVERLRVYDARGVRVGVEPLDRWARFHNGHGLDADEGCVHCFELVAEFSSVDVGAV